MYAGKVVERASTEALFADPLHPYTQGLLASVPGFYGNEERERLPTIPGVVPDLRDLPAGCRFRERLRPGGGGLRGGRAVPGRRRDRARAPAGRLLRRGPRAPGLGR